MNSKIVALVAVTVMVAAALAGAMAIQGSDADTIEDPALGNVEVDVIKGGSDAVVMLKVSEAEYLPLGYTLTWEIAQATGSEGPYTYDFSGENDILAKRTIQAGTSLEAANAITDNNGVSFQNDALKFKMEKTEDLGTYILRITATDGATSGVFGIKCSVTTGSSNYVVPSVYGVIDVTVKGQTQAISLVEMKVPVGIPFYQKIQVDGESPTDVPADMSWYAVRLPQGLSMSPDGIVSGMMTEKIADGNNNTVTVAVYATDSSGTVTEYSLTISNKEATETDVTIALTSESTNFKEPTEGGNTYTAQQGSTVKLSVSIPVDSESSLDVVGVRIIGDDGDRYTSYTDNMEVPTGGIGQYRICVSYILDGVSNQDYVVLNVVSDIDAIQAGVVIEGA